MYDEPNTGRPIAACRFDRIRPGQRFNCLDPEQPGHRCIRLQKPTRQDAYGELINGVDIDTGAVLFIPDDQYVVPEIE